MQMTYLVPSCLFVCFKFGWVALPITDQIYIVVQNNYLNVIPHRTLYTEFH